MAVEWPEAGGSGIRDGTTSDGTMKAQSDSTAMASRLDDILFPLIGMSL